MSEPLLWWGFGLMVGALFVLFLELFVPSGGLLGIVSATLAVASVVSFWRHSTTWGLTSLLGVVVLGPVVLAYMVKIYPDTFIGRRMILGGTEPADEDGSARPAAEEAPSALVGVEGTALTDLRPVGMVELDGARHEAMSEFGVIDSGQRVRVTKVEGDRIRVRVIS